MTNKVARTFFLCVLSTTLLITLVAFSASATTNPDKMTLHRFPDPVIIQAKSFPALTGSPLAGYRLYASKQDLFAPIRFQIDEMNEAGDLIFLEGKKNNKTESNGILDPQDILLFMAHDAGDRVHKPAWPKKLSKGVEIKIIDPIDETIGWVYLFFFEKNPPALCPLPDYFHYNHDANTASGEYWKAKYIITKDGKRTGFYKQHFALPPAGGTGENYVDRLKIRATIKLFFGKMTLKANEENLGSNTLAWKQGPIRVIRRIEQYLKGPMNVKLMRAIVDVQFYETAATVPVLFKFPFKIDNMVTSFVIRFGTDYSPIIKGSKFYNSSNPKGVIVDGKMGEEEKNFNDAPDKWRVMTGKWGSFMTRSVMTEKATNYMQIVQGITDDENLAQPPEAFPGSIGYTWQDWHVGQLPGGNYSFYLEFYTPPNYKLGDEVAYLNYLDHPLKIEIADKISINQVKLFATPGKRF